MSHLSEELQAQLLDGNWDVFEQMAFPKFGAVHVDEFPLANAHRRIEGADYGLNGTAWFLVPVDFDGNVIFHDCVYAQNLLPDDVAELVTAQRAAGWGANHSAYIDPSVWQRTGTRNQWGRDRMLVDEFADAGVPLIRATNDPRAGYVRLRTLMEPDPAHPFPEWHPRAGELGAPRLFIVGRRCPELVEQVRSAPLQPVDKRDGGEMIDPDWERRSGHAVAAARYSVMAWLPSSKKPEKERPEEDPRGRRLAEIRGRVRDRNRALEREVWEAIS
jgi:hypothetical protein